MEGLRLNTVSGYSPVAPCNRCQATGCPWDRIGEQAVCPDCQEQLALGTTPVLVEAYLLHFEADLYGESSRVSFVARLRDERQFDSVDALIAQMHQDAAAAERVLSAGR